ncbi:hypothetical protein Tco_0071940, partial [Tanacetum coccineum]
NYRLRFSGRKRKENRRRGEELIQESSKKQKVDDDKEIAELKQCMEIILDEKEVTIVAIPLAIKICSQMLKIFNKEDLEDLYKLVKAKYKSTRPVEDLDLSLWGDLKIMFEPHIEDVVWRNQQDYKVLDWKLYDSCGVHSMRMQHVYIHMLLEKKYPLIPSTLIIMLEKKLQIDYESEMAYQLLKFIMKQLKKNLLDAVGITTAQVYVNTALIKLVLLMNFKENILKEYNSPSKEDVNSPSKENANSPSKENANLPSKENANLPSKENANSPSKENANSPPGED